MSKRFADVHISVGPVFFQNTYQLIIVLYHKSADYKMEGYIHGPEYREVKEPQGSPSRSVADLFRMDKRTIRYAHLFFLG